MIRVFRTKTVEALKMTAPNTSPFEDSLEQTGPVAKNFVSPAQAVDGFAIGDPVIRKLRLLKLYIY